MFKKAIALIGAFSLTAFASVSHAAPVPITGYIDTATGALASLTPPGTAFSGYLDWTGTLDGAQVLLGGFCFTDDASGVPPTSGTCGAVSAVPILPTGETIYDGTPAAPGSTFEQAGTTFDGTSGDINILTFSPTFNVFIPIAITFYDDYTGTVFADAGVLGSACGGFVVPILSEIPVRPQCSLPELPIPGAAWLFGSALLGLGVVMRKGNKANA